MSMEDNLVGKWLWLHNRKIHVVSHTPEDGFLMIEEPGSPWGPRPVHFSNLKGGEIVSEGFKTAQMETEMGVETGFCSCCEWRTGMSNIRVTTDAVVNIWDAEKAAKQIEDFFRTQGMAGVHVRAEASGTRCLLRFFLTKGG